MSSSWSNNASNLIILVEDISGYSGLFGYSPNVGPGNLVFSLTAAAGTDPYGNAYVAGIGLYGASGQLTAIDTAGNTAKMSGNIGGGGLLAALPGLSFQPVVNTGDPAAIGGLDDGAGDLSLLLTSPSPVVGGVAGTDFSQINMNGPYNGNKPNITLSADAPGATIDVNGSEFDSNGILTQYGFNAYNTYTPVVTGGGSATFSTRTGWWQRIGGLVFFNAYIVVNAAGSGAGTISVTTPTNIDRTTRQSIPAQVDAAAIQGSFDALCFTGGTANVIDRLRSSTDANLTGANLSANAVMVIQGWYREA